MQSLDSPLELLRPLFGNRKPALLLGQTLVMDRHDDVLGDLLDDLQIVLVEPVGLLLGKGQESAHLLAEDQGHDDERADPVLEDCPVGRIREVELALAFPHQHRLAGQQAGREREVLEPRGASLRPALGDAQPLLHAVGLEEGGGHDIEVENGLDRGGEPIEDLRLR